MKYLTAILMSIGLAACSQPKPKTGAMPGVANGGYNAPSGAEAATAYIEGFHHRFDIPQLDYPQDIKDRIKIARMAQFERQMRNGQKRSQLMARLGLMASKDPEAKKLLKEIRTAPKFKLGEDKMARLIALADSKTNRNSMSASERNKKYETAVKDYKAQFKGLEIETCRWTEMRRLIGSGHEDMAFIHGHHPTHGFLCAVNVTLEKRKGYPRTASFSDFWVKSQSGNWNYFGKFRGVEAKPRLQRLNADLLRDPEGTIKRQSMSDMIATSFN